MLRDEDTESGIGSSSWEELAIYVLDSGRLDGCRR